MDRSEPETQVMSQPAVEVRNLTKVFALSMRKNYVVAVEDLSLTVGAGEV